MGYYNADGAWIHEESDIADPGEGFSELLNKGTLTVPTQVHNRVVAELNADPTIRQSAIALVDQELEGRNLVEGTYGDAGEAVAGLAGENGRGTDFMVDAQGRAVSSTIDRWYVRLVDRGMVPGRSFTTDVAAGGIMGENKRGILLFREDGTLTLDTVRRLAAQLGPELTDYLPPTVELADVVLNGSRRLRRADGTAVVSRSDMLAAWGDSLTAGWPTSDFGTSQPSPLAWPGVLDSEWAGTAYNGGVSGQSADEIALRQGGYALTVEAVTVPASGGVQVTAQQTFAWRLDRGWSCVGTLGGVPGTLTRSGSVLTFTRSASGDAVPIPAGTLFVSAQGEANKESVQVIFAGRNDIGYSSPAGDPVDRVVAATVAMVERPGVQHRRTLLVGTTTSTGETRGTTGYAQVTDINSTLARMYPHMFYDLRGYLVNEAIHDLGITPTATDVSRMAGDTLPPSIMAVNGTDGVHYSVATAALVAARIREQLDLRDWIVD